MIPAPLEQLLRELETFPEVQRIILFGSRARGDGSPRSDIDLAIDAPTMTRGAWLRLLDAADEAPTLLPLDVLHLQAASPALRHRIEAEGRTLYDRAA